MELEKQNLFEPLFKHGAEIGPAALDEKTNYKVVEVDEVWMVENILTKEEADLLIEAGEKAGYIEAEYVPEAGKGRVVKEVRDSLRVEIYNEPLAKYLYKRTSELVPRAYEGGLLIGINDKFRFLKYHKPGCHFFAHIDGHQEKSEFVRSAITFQIYLTEGFEGGQTTFIEWCLPGGRYECIPKVGKGVFFRQTGWIHEGSPMKSGVKYTVLTDFMYKWFTTAEAEEYMKEVKEIPTCSICGVKPRFVPTNCEHAFLACYCSPFNSVHAGRDGGEKIDQKQSYCSICKEKFKLPDDIKEALLKKFAEKKIRADKL